MKKIITTLVLLGSLATAPALAEGFNPNYIMDDNEVNDYTSMTLSDIQQFLNDRGGYLANYRTNACLTQDLAFGLPCSGPLMSAAEIIFDRSQPRWYLDAGDNTYFKGINPKYLLTLLQKEQSLIEDETPTQGQLDTAVGYGCPDSGGCNPRFKGFWRQINSASLQMRWDMDNPQLNPYKVGQTYVINNAPTAYAPTVVTPQNQFTCTLYKYTPHVYNGNFNFYNIWQRYFSIDYPNGTLLQMNGSPTVWLIQNGTKRAFRSRGALTSRYNISKVIMVSKTDLDKYVTGPSINFSQYSIVRAPSGALFLLVDDTRRGFVSRLAFKKLGFSTDEIVNAKWEELAAYKEVEPLTATTSYPTGALLQDKKTGGIYYVSNGKKAPIPDRAYLNALFKYKKPFPVTTAELNKYATVDPVRFPDGELLKGRNGTAVYVIADGRKHAINSAKVFESLRYNWKNIVIVPDKILYLYPDGEPLKEKNAPTNGGNPLEITAAATSTATATSLQ